MKSILAKSLILTLLMTVFLSGLYPDALYNMPWLPQHQMLLVAVDDVLHSCAVALDNALFMIKVYSAFIVITIYNQAWGNIRAP